jgi:DNA-binding LacI/PurR family transcriptional regulator
MAETAARMAITLSRGVEPVSRRLDLATSLVVRQSTAAPATPLALARDAGQIGD